MSKVMNRIAVLVLVLSLCGCSLAKEDAGVEGEVSQDRFVGVFVTTEYLDLFDFEAYLNDNAGEILNGNSSNVEIVNGTAYNGRIYATVDKHDSTEPRNWEITFGDVEGVCFFDGTWQNEGEEPFSMVTCGDEICDAISHVNISDEGESLELTGTMYVLGNTQEEEMGFYLNPVYQTAAGEFYVTSGMGHFMAGEGGSFSSSLSEEVTLTENGESKISSTSVTMYFEVCEEPEMLYLYQMDAAHQVVKEESYEPGMLPEQLTMEAETAYIIVETKWADGGVTRELFEREESEPLNIETFYKKSDSVLGKQSTEVVWE